MGMMKEFKEFAMRGNVVDLAVGVVIGAAFGKIVSSVVADVIMPPVGLMLGGVEFTDMKAVLKEAVGETPAVTLNYGTFIQSCVDFLIIAFAIFVLVKGINSLKRKEADTPPPPAPPSPEQVLLGEIRDLLRAKSAKS